MPTIIGCGLEPSRGSRTCQCKVKGTTVRVSTTTVTDSSSERHYLPLLESARASAISCYRTSQ
eukprot:14584233-Alexandrium_andersonii.AAC.1